MGKFSFIRINEVFIHSYKQFLKLKKTEREREREKQKRKKEQSNCANNSFISH